jgi:hypothetical protein
MMTVYDAREDAGDHHPRRASKEKYQPWQKKM